jgi:tetratricopeptide (TPR) repeat protein
VASSFQRRVAAAAAAALLLCAGGVLAAKGAAKLRLKKVQDLLVKGDVDAARGVLEAWVKGTPDDILGLASLARLHIHQRPDDDSLDQAKKLIKHGRKVAPHNAEIWTEWGYLALARWQLPDAVERFKHVIGQLAPSGFRAYHGLARAYIRLGRYQYARNAMRSCLDAGPAVAENHWMAGNVEFAATHEVGSFERAVGHYLYAAELDDTDPRYKGWAIMAHFAGHRYQLAKPIERALRAQDPQNSYLLVAEGLREELNADPGSARDYYQRAVDLDWYNPWAHWCLAMIWLGKGNLELIQFTNFNTMFYGPYSKPSNAEEHLMAVDNVYPEFPFREKLRPYLKELASQDDGRSDPIFREHLRKFQKYWMSIKRSPPKVDWSKRKEW